MIKEITTSEEFKDVIKESCIVDFYGEDCPNCKNMADIMEKIRGDIPIYKFKIDRAISLEIKSISVIMGVPTACVYSDGKEMFRTNNQINPMEFEELFDLYKK